MKKEVGLWIDHRQAVIVTLHDGTETVEHVTADFEKRGNYTSDVQSLSESSLRMDLAEDKHERHTQAMVDHYYDAVVAHLKDATDLYIMGPGQAKTEFQKYIETQKLPAAVLRVEPADKLSDAQIAARVRQSFERHIH
jgi:stalled ribosome rescue protein Dom34